MSAINRPTALVPCGFRGFYVTAMLKNVTAKKTSETRMVAGPL
jgi:hypothetical protein